MKRSFPVIDADGHVLERNRELRQFLRPEFRAVAGTRRDSSLPTLCSLLRLF